MRIRQKTGLCLSMLVGEGSGLGNWFVSSIMSEHDQNENVTKNLCVKLSK